MVRRGGIRSILMQGYPFLVLKIEGDKDKIEAVIHSLAPSRMDIAKIGDILRPLDINKELRVGTTFSPDEWYNPGAWSYYSWPFYSFLAEVGREEFQILPYTKENERKFWAYCGLGIAAIKWIRPGEVKEAYPVGFLLLYPPKPRRVAVFEREGNRVYVYSALPYVRNVLVSRGYRALNEYTFCKDYRDEEEMARELAEIDRVLRSRFVSTFMLHGLRELVRRVAA